MIKIGNEILILKNEDLYDPKMDDSVTGFRLPKEVYNSVGTIIYLTEKYFTILKTSLAIEKIGLLHGIKYDRNIYSNFLYMFYFYKNNDVLLFDAKKEAF